MDRLCILYLGGTGRTGPNLKEWKTTMCIWYKICMGASTGDLITATDEEVEFAARRGVICRPSEDR